MNNFTLEMSPADQHPRYLSVLGLCFAFPLLLSPLMGWVVETISVDAVFLVVSVAVFLGWLQTFRLHEPRQAVLVEVPLPVVPEDD